MKRKKMLVILLSVFLAALVLSACNFDSSEESGGNTEMDTNSETPNSETDEGRKVIHLFETNEIPTLDSVHTHDLVGFTVLNNVGEGLYRRNPENQPEYAMAEKHEQSADGLVHTFTIRDTAWSNGTPVTAYDFEYAWKRALREEGHYGDMFATVGMLNGQEILDGEKDADELGVRAVDEKTLEVTLTQANPLFTNLLSFPVFFPQNQEFVESQGEQYGSEYTTTLYNGPFILTDWKHDQSWQYQPNPNYWDAESLQIDEINVYVVKEVATGINLYETGELDRTNVSSTYVDQYRNSDEFEIMKEATIFFLRFNHEHPALGNVNIRRAISMAFDKEGLTDVILNDGSFPLHGLVASGFYFSPEGQDFRELNGDFNQGSMEEMLAYWNQGLAEIGQDEVEVSILIADQDERRKTAEYLKYQLESNLPGFTLNLNTVPTEQRLALERAIDFDISLSNWGPDYADPMTYIDMWVTGGSANRMHYSNPDFDQLVAQAKAETDMSARFQLMLEAERILLEEDAAIAPMYQRGQGILLRSNIKGFVHHPSAPTYSYKWISVE